MMVKLSIRVVIGDITRTGCIIQSTEVIIDGNTHLVDAIIAKIKEIPDVEVE